MITLILFNLKRRFLNRMTLLINAVLLAVILFVFHADYFLGNNVTARRFFIDDSVGEYQSSFLAMERDYRIYNGKIDDDDVLVRYDGRFTIISNSPLDAPLLEEIKGEIRQAIRETHVRRYPSLAPMAEEYAEIQENISEQNRPADNLWIVASAVYFLLMNYSSTVASEVVYEKSNHLLESLLTAITPQKHLLSKVIQGYLTVVIQLLLAALFAALAFLTRWLEDGFAGLKQFISAGNLPVLAQTELDAGWPQILLMGGIMISALMIVQTVMLLVCSRLNGSEQAAGLQGVFYVLLLAGYYLLLMNGQQWVSEGSYVQLLAGLPVISGYLMSCLLLLGRASLLQGSLALGINLVTLLVIVELSGKRYRQNLLRF